MKKTLLCLFLVITTVVLQAQQGGKDAIPVAASQRPAANESPAVKLTIYPVPVTNNFFNIRADKDIAFVKVTNIIGQEAYRTRFSNPQQNVRIELDSPQRGMYLVTIMFSDGLRIVKKIMVEDSK
jgi:hypothetical protein